MGPECGLFASVGAGAAGADRLRRLFADPEGANALRSLLNESIVFPNFSWRGRLRTHTIRPPRADSATAPKRNRTASLTGHLGSREPNIVNFASVEAPAFAFSPDFALPNRGGCLQAVNAVAGSLKGHIAMRRSSNDNNR